MREAASTAASSPTAPSVPPGYVRHLGGQGSRALVLPAAEVEDPGVRAIVEIVAGEERSRAGVAVAVERAVDELRVTLAKIFVGEAQLVGAPGPKRLDDGIGGTHDLEGGRGAVDGLQVERDGTLAAVEEQVHSRAAVGRRSSAADVVAGARTLDLDDVSTHVSEQLRHRGAG